MRLLLIEDDKNLALSLKKILSKTYVVDVVHSGHQALNKIFDLSYDLIILDIQLPDLSGIELCQTIRDEEIKTPILLLTGFRDTCKVSTGLDAGADDYLTKPYDPEELLARIRALLRRKKHFPTQSIKLGKLILNSVNRTMTFLDKNVRLSRQEFLLLEFLLLNANTAVSRQKIVEHAWDQAVNQNNSVDVHINKLRKKIADNFKLKLIETINGYGYKAIY
jgi:DNA-binding response OmpR family regulator